MAKAYAFWLMPSEPQKGLLHKTIRHLAAEFDAPSFDPHVTFFVAEGLSQVQANSIVEKVAAQFGSVQLEAEKLDQSERYSKTLYIQFHPSEILQSLFATAKQNSPSPSSYDLNPHLSLLYQHLGEEQRKELCRRALAPLGLYRFDSVCGVEFSPPWSENAAKEYRVATGPIALKGKTNIC